MRGIALIAILEYIRSRFDVAGVSSFMKRLPFDVSHVVINAEKGKWYPFSVEGSLRSHIVEFTNSGEPRKVMGELGRFVASYEIESFLRGIFSFLPLQLVFKRFGNIWSKLYRPGRLLVRSSHDLGAVFELAGFASDPLFCPMAQAWLETAAHQLRLKKVKISETLCIHRGARRCRWELGWQTTRTIAVAPANQERFAGRVWAKRSTP